MTVPRFTVGDRVRLSALGVESKISRRCATGVVVKVCEKPHLIVVKRDLFPLPVQYHQDFWELDLPPTVVAILGDLAARTVTAARAHGVESDAMVERLIDEALGARGITGVGVELSMANHVRVPRAIRESPHQRVFIWRGKVRRW